MNNTTTLIGISSWQRARCIALDRICRDIRKHLSSGIHRKTAFKAAVKAHDGQILGETKGKARLLRLSLPTLRRLYKQWEYNPSPATFRQNYQSGKVRMPVELVTEFQRRCTLEGMEEISVVIDWLKKDWREGKDLPGISTWQVWWLQNHPGTDLPAQAPDFPWSDRCLYNYAPSQAEKAWGNHGKAAARKLLPFVKRDYSKLRPYELFVLDDVRLDILCIDDQTGKPTEARAYIMMEAGSRSIVSYTLRPANAMMGKDVDACIARGLQASGMGREYTTHILLERGTVAMTEPAKLLLEKASEDRISIHRTAMNGGRRWLGAPQDQGSGHWMGKGVIESFMRKLHLMLRTVPGQRGSDYKKQPANLGHSGQDNTPIPRSLAAEAAKLADIELSLNRRVKLDLGLLWLSELNNLMREAITLHNKKNRDHNYQGFGSITLQESAPGVWLPASNN